MTRHFNVLRLPWRLAGLMLAALSLGCGPAPPATRTADLALLAEGATGFAQAQPDVPLVFPRDHGEHPGFRIEWWYLTANLRDERGRAFGAQWTLFRFAVQPPALRVSDNPWQSGQVFMAHLAITSPDDHVAFQRYARGGEHEGVRQAGVTSEPFAAWLDDWSLASTGSDWLPLELQAAQGEFGIDLKLQGNGPLVLQGESGFSQKHPDGGGSHYYSQPFLELSGSVQWAGESITVSGQGWLDREWSSQFLQQDQSGWDWFALHLDSGEKLMLFRLRSRTTAEDFQHAVLIAADGGKRPLDPARVQLSVLREASVAGRKLPLHWRIELPEIGRVLRVEALHEDQWLDVDFPYWEGAVTVTGERPAETGVGYLELTGYAP
jgi:predicted secreted hydrolase